MKTLKTLGIAVLLLGAGILTACQPIFASAQEMPPAEISTEPSISQENPTEMQAEEPPAEPADTPAEPVSEHVAAGWLGAVYSLPEGSQYDDYLALSPEGTGELGLSGATPEIEEAIVALRDHAEPGKYAHFWGTVSCDVMDYNGCQMLVTRIRSGANATPPEPVDAWEGTLMPSTFNGGDSNVFVLAGDYPIWYSIHSNDPAVLDQLLALRQTTGQVRVWGELLTGIPDVNGARIQASRVEAVDTGEARAEQTSSEPASIPGWKEYCSPHYGYCIQYPENAELSESGIQSVPADEAPADGDLDSYFAQLEETYGKDLCVQIRTPLAYLYISSPANTQFKYAICGRTGVGAGEMTDVSQDVVVMGKTYTAKGFTINMGGDTSDLYNETLVFTLEDGTRIEYGTLPRSDANFTDYEMKGRPLVQQILETYRLAQ